MQGDKQWELDRCGCITASRAKDIVKRKNDGKPYQARANYFNELLVERITGEPKENGNFKQFQWGHDVEVRATEEYEERTGLVVQEVDFIKHLNHKWIGGSPDGLIGDDGGAEIKSPYDSGVHLDTFLNGMPEDHDWQCQFNMWVTDRMWWDYVSYDPRMPEKLRFFRHRVERDQELIFQMEREIFKFSDEIDEAIEEIFASAAIAA